MMTACILGMLSEEEQKNRGYMLGSKTIYHGRITLEGMWAELG